MTLAEISKGDGRTVNGREPTPRTAPPGTRVMVTHEARNYTDTIPAGSIGTVRWYSPEHRSDHGGGFDVAVIFPFRTFLGPDFKAMGGKWQDETGRTILVRDRASATVWSRHLAIVE